MSLYGKQGDIDDERTAYIEDGGRLRSWKGFFSFGGVRIFLPRVATPSGIATLMARIHAYAPGNKKILSQIGSAFLVAFAVLELINRFLQFTILGQQREGLAMSDLYNPRSVALALEMLSWGFFLGLATLFVALVFSGGKLEHWIKGLLSTNGILCIVNGIGYVLANQVDPVQIFASNAICLCLFAFFNKLINSAK